MPDQPAVTTVLADLEAEGAELQTLVDGADLAQATPADGWSIADQLGHLAWTDSVSIVAATDAGAFASLLADAAADAGGYVDRASAEWAARDDLIEAWQRGRVELAEALRTVARGTKLPWFGPPMSAASMATARLMETWAHGQDVADALGVRRTPTDRLRHVAHIGVRTRDFAYAANGLGAPAEAFRVDLIGPSGDAWTWGPEDATQRVAGPALDFCLLVTQRRHRGDLALVAEGPDADAWLDIAQAFAGPPGNGRAKGQFT